MQNSSQSLAQTRLMSYLCGAKKGRDGLCHQRTENSDWASSPARVCQESDAQACPPVVLGWSAAINADTVQLTYPTNSIEGFWGHFKRVIFSTYHCVSKDYVQRYIDELSYRWNTREEKSSFRFHDMFVKAVKHFDYNDVLSLSSVVDTEYRTFHNRVYYAWYTRNDVA